MVKFAKTLAANTDLKSCQSFLFSEGEIYLGIIILGSGDDCFTIIRQSISELEESFFAQEAALPERLSVALVTLQEKLATLTEVEILLSAISQDKILYLQGIGRHKAYLLRGGISNLIPDTSNSQLISGYLNPGDKLLLVSSSLDQYLVSDQSKIEKIFQSGVDSLEEEVTSFVLEHPDTHPLAAILIDCSEAKEADEVVLPEQPIMATVMTNLDGEKKFNPKVLIGLLSNLKTAVPKTHKGRLILGAVLLVLVLLIVGVSVKNKSQAQSNAKFSALLTQAKD